MFAYEAYKHHKERKEREEGINSNAGTFRKLSTESDTTPLGIDMDPNGLERQPTFVEVNEKGQTRKQLITLAISLTVDVILPIVLYVSEINNGIFEMNELSKLIHIYAFSVSSMSSRTICP
jgi:hypothetical protein